jgi:hypothetical protein
MFSLFARCHKGDKRPSNWNGGLRETVKASGSKDTIKSKVIKMKKFESYVTLEEGGRVKVVDYEGMAKDLIEAVNILEAKVIAQGTEINNLKVLTGA